MCGWKDEGMVLHKAGQKSLGTRLDVWLER